MSEYIVDGAIGATYTTNPTEEMQYQVKFFQSATLTPGRHTLEVVNETEDGWLSLDFFLVANSTKTSAPSTSPASSTLSSPSPRPSSISQSTVTVAFIPASTPSMGSSAVDTSTSTSNRKRPNAGVVAGSILGGMIGLILLIALIWFIRRKNADRYADEAAAIPADAPTPTSKATRSLALAHHSHNSRTNPGYDASVKSDAVAQAHHQQPYQQHNHRRSNASASSVYPFSHSVAEIAQQAYHSDPANDRQREQSPAPPYFGSPQQCRPQPHERQHSMDPSRSGTPSLGHCHSPSTDGPSISGYNLSRQSPRTNLGVREPGSASEIVNAQAGYEHSSQYSSGIALRPF